MTKDTDVHELYKNTVNLILHQNNVFQNSKFGWSLEEMLYIELKIVNKLFENTIETISSVGSNYSNENYTTISKTGKYS